jgi:hypothetical protein
MILDALKKRLYRENKKAPDKWLKELPTVVWVSELSPVAIWAPLPTSWSTVQKRCSLPISLFDHQGLRELQQGQV